MKFIRIAAMAAALASAPALGGSTVAGVPAPTADSRAEGPSTLVLTYRVAPAARLNLREAMRATLLPRLDRMRLDGDLARYKILVNRFVDAASWDVLVMLEFKSSAALARWRTVEDTAPAGLPLSALRLVSSIETAPGTVVRETSPMPGAGGPAPVYLVVPYEYFVSADDYLHYVDGYLLPQLAGWTQERALARYQLFLPSYAAGRGWSSLLLLAYRGDTGLDARERVVKTVRARLGATSPDWKAFADNKAKIRAEKQAVVADELTP